MGAAVLLIIVLGTLTGCPGKTDIPTIPAEQLTDEQKTILETALAWRRDIQSTDGQTRVAALDRVQPNEADFATLYGPEIAAVLWEDSQKGLEVTRESYLEKQSKLARSGDVLGGGLIDLRTDTTANHDYTDALAMLPPDLDLYRVMFTMGKGRQSHTAFAIVNGEVRLIGGLEQMPAYVAELREQGKIGAATATSDTTAVDVPATDDSASE